MDGHRLVRPIGGALTLACLFFFGTSLLDLDPEHLLELPIPGLVGSIVLSSLVYAGLLVGVTFGFAHLLKAGGHADARPRDALVVWGKANIAKYLPGNVFHFAGRHLLGRRFDWPQGTIALASLLELALQLALPCAIAMLLLLLPLGRLGLLGHAGWLLPVSMGVLFVLMLAASGEEVRRRLPPALARLHLPAPAALVPALPAYLAFFFGMACIAWLLHGLIEGRLSLASLPYLFAAFLVSWVLGLIVPGSPGGIGVREASFAFLASALLGSAGFSEDGLIMAALLMRCVTLFGEGLLFLCAVWLDRSRPPRPAAAPLGGTRGTGGAGGAARYQRP